MKININYANINFNYMKWMMNYMSRGLFPVALAVCCNKSCFTELIVIFKTSLFKPYLCSLIGIKKCPTAIHSIG